jgi:transcriptional regulator with XRE-family HTH domain
MIATAQWPVVTAERGVQERRQRLGLTQVELADAAGVALKTVQNIEQGRPASRSLNKVLAALDDTEARRSPPSGVASGRPDRLRITMRNGDGYEISVEVDREKVGDVDVLALARALTEAHHATFRHTRRADGTASGGSGGNRQVSGRERPVSW